MTKSMAFSLLTVLVVVGEWEVFYNRPNRVGNRKNRNENVI